MQPYLWSKPPEEDQGIPKQKMKNGPSFTSVAYHCSIWCVQSWRLPLEPPWLISCNCEVSFSTMTKTQSFLSDSISDTHLLQTLLVFIQCIFVRFLLWALWDLPGGASAKEPTCHHRRCKRRGLGPWVGKIPWRRDRLPTPVFLGFPGGSDGKEFACNVGDLGLISGLGRSPGRGHGNPLQYSCLENPHGQRSLAATVHRVTKSWTQLKKLRALLF